VSEAPLEILDVTATERFARAGADQPRQILRVALRGGPGSPVRVEVRTRSGDRGAAEVPANSIAEVPVPVAAQPGATVDVEVAASAGEHTIRREYAFRAAEPGWRLFLVPHFHYDPVFWNNQANYTEYWRLSGLPWEDPFQRPGLDLVRAHLDRAEADPDYAFVLSELDYLKPYWDSFPADRSRIRRLIDAGRVELVGGMYNQPDSNLSGAETLVRSLIYGVAYHRDVIGGRPRVGWQLDAFGHAPGFPSLAAGAGLDAVVFARGPHHAWGPWWYKHADIWLDPPAGCHAPAQAPPSSAAEYDWIGPGGGSVLAAYLAAHYHAGWWIDRAGDLDQAQELAFDLFTRLKPYAATRNVLLLVGTDYTPPNRWLPDLVRAWNSRYAWPRFECATPSAFVAAVRSHADRGRRRHSGPARLLPASRDLNPVFAGTYVAAIGGKLAHRAGEVAVGRAETLATIAAQLGAPYPDEVLDRAWRLLLFASHHDGVTGSHSDQVHLDLLGGWREAYELAESVTAQAMAAVARQVDTRGDGAALVVFNPSSWPRTDVVRVTVHCDRLAARGVVVRDGSGRDVPFLAEALTRTADGRLDVVRLAFVARDVPAVGYASYRLMPASQTPPAASWRQLPGHQIANERLQVVADPAAGGALVRIVDTVVGRDILSGLGNELVAYGQHPDHPRFAGEGLWHIYTDGSARSSAEQEVQVRVEESAAAQRLTVRSPFAGGWRTQETWLWAGLDRVEFVTRLDGITDEVLVRARFGFDAPGARPVCDTGGAVVGRGFGTPEADTAEVAGVGEHAARWWCGLSPSPGSAEIVVPAGVSDAAPLAALVGDLAARGVTASVTRDTAARHGCPDVDTNLPDFRIAIGTAAENLFSAAVLAQAPAAAAELAERGHVWLPGRLSPAELARPNTDRRGEHDLPTLVVTEPGQALAALDSRPPASAVSVALFNRGTPGWTATADGHLTVSLLRVDSLWPHGCWPGRESGGAAAPDRPGTIDGGRFSPLSGSHTFEYAVAAGPGDWRAAGLDRRAREYAMPLTGVVVDAHPGPLPTSHSFIHVEPSSVLVEAVKPAGDPIARFCPRTGPRRELVVRLQERHGAGGDVRVRFGMPVTRPALTTLLEDGRSWLPEMTGDTLHLPIDAAATVTLAVHGADLATASAPPAGLSGEVVPVYARYWRHNAGPAPLGYQPLTAQIHPEHAITAGQPIPVTVTVASSWTQGPASRGTVRFDLPEGWRAEPAGLAYEVAPGDHRDFEALIRPGMGVLAGRYFVSAVIRDHLGQQHEDVLRVDIGPEATEELVAEPVGGPITVRPGEDATLRLRLRNLVRSTIRGQAQAISPFGTWPLVSPRTLPVRVEGHGVTDLAFRVAVPPGHPAGAWWVSVKLTWLGRCRYTPAVPVTVSGDETVGGEAVQKPG
jgi:alpha-mannosidase